MTVSEGLNPYCSLKIRKPLWHIVFKAFLAACIVSSLMVAVYAFMQKGIGSDRAVYSSVVLAICLGLVGLNALNAAMEIPYWVAYTRKPDGGYEIDIYISLTGGEERFWKVPGFHVLFPLSRWKMEIITVGDVQTPSSEETHKAREQLCGWRFRPFHLVSDPADIDSTLVRLEDPNGNRSMAMSLPAAAELLVELILEASDGNRVSNSLAGAFAGFRLKKLAQSELIVELRARLLLRLSRLDQALDFLVALFGQLSVDKGAVTVPETAASLRKQIETGLKRLLPADDERRKSLLDGLLPPGTVIADVSPAAPDDESGHP